MAVESCNGYGRVLYLWRSHLAPVTVEFCTGYSRILHGWRSSFALMTVVSCTDDGRILHWLRSHLAPIISVGFLLTFIRLAFHHFIERNFLKRNIIFWNILGINCKPPVYVMAHISIPNLPYFVFFCIHIQYNIIIKQFTESQCKW